MTRCYDDDDVSYVRCECGRAVPCRHCPTIPTPIDPADIRPGDVFRVTYEATCEDVTMYGAIYDDKGTLHDPDDAAGFHLVHRPDPHAEAVEALREASWSVRNDGSGHDPLPGLPEAAELFRHLGLNGWDVVRRAES